MHWKPSSEKPKLREPILMRGPSGYVSPNSVAYVSGYFDDEYRPHYPWLCWDGDTVDILGGVPTHWIYISDLLSVTKLPDTIDAIFNVACDTFPEYPAVRTKL